MFRLGIPVESNQSHLLWQIWYHNYVTIIHPPGDTWGLLFHFNSIHSPTVHTPLILKQFKSLDYCIIFIIISFEVVVAVSGWFPCCWLAQYVTGLCMKYQYILCTIMMYRMHVGLNNTNMNTVIYILVRILSTFAMGKHYSSILINTYHIPVYSVLLKLVAVHIMYW